MLFRSSFRFIWLVALIGSALVGCGGAPAPTPSRALAPTTIAPLIATPLALPTQPPLPTNPPAPTLTSNPSIKATPTL